MARLIWQLPGWFHGGIELMTGWRMMEVIWRNEDGAVTKRAYKWTRDWPNRA